MIAHEILLVLKDLYDIELPNLLHCLKMLPQQILLDFDFPSKDGELVIEAQFTELAIHELKDGLELVVKFVLEDEGIDDLQVNISGEVVNGVTDEDREELVPLTLEILEVIVIGVF